MFKLFTQVVTFLCLTVLLSVVSFPTLSTKAAGLANSYVCEPQHAVGLVGTGLDWSPKVLEGTKFIVRRLGSTELAVNPLWPRSDWGAFEVGDEIMPIPCKESGTLLTCDDVFTSLKFNSENYRFEAFLRGNYLFPGPGSILDRQNRPTVQIGQCIRVS